MSEQVRASTGQLQWIVDASPLEATTTLSGRGPHPPPALATEATAPLEAAAAAT